MEMLFLELPTHHNDEYKLADLEPSLVSDNLQCQAYSSGQGMTYLLPSGCWSLEESRSRDTLAGQRKDCGGKTLSERPSETQGTTARSAEGGQKKRTRNVPGPVCSSSFNLLETGPVHFLGCPREVTEDIGLTAASR